MKKWILLIVMGIFVLIPVVFWANTLASGNPLGVYLYAVGRVLALVGFVFLFFQFVFSSRIKWIERGIGLDKLFAIHRTSGISGMILILIHPSFLTLSDLVQGNPLSLSRAKIVGFVALLILAIGAGAALLYRQLDLSYETWKKIHWATYVGLPAGFLHSFLFGSDTSFGPLRTFWIVLGVLYLAILGAKLWNRFQVRRRPYQIAEVVQETHDTWSLYFQGERFDYKPGQFLIVNLIRDGRVSEPHPFTISSSPTQDRLSISVKAVGNFTATIGDTKTSDRAYIDAPYGVFSFLHHDAQNLVFILGGIGITPCMSMLRYIYDEKLDRNVTLIWGNKSERDITFRDELERMAAEMPSLRTVHVMAHQEDWPGEKGYVTTETLIKYVGDVPNPQVFLCGPPIMMTKLLESLRELGVPKKRIHYERFALR
jgi:predicted ferric reductase